VCKIIIYGPALENDDEDDEYDECEYNEE